MKIPRLVDSRACTAAEPRAVAAPVSGLRPATIGVERANSATKVFNCMGHALGVNSWLQGAARKNDWPEETLVQQRGCTSVACGTACNTGHKVKLYEYLNEDQFHIVRQDSNTSWSGKVGTGSIYDFQDPDAHTTAAYGIQPKDWRATCWCCP